MKSLRIFLLASLAPVLAPAAPGRLERDLGHGLTYCRVHDLPTDLPAVTAQPGALVLDLRYTRGTDAAATALGAWFTAHCSAATPVFVLVNGATAPGALAWFTAHEPPAGLITLGVRSPHFEPDIELNITPAAERAAYDALEHGTRLAALLTDPAVKPRHDEASIAQDRTGPAEETDSDSTDVPEATPAPPPPPPPVIDEVLLRAVQVHRALLALRNA